jgi:hypothetical protein
MTPEAAFEKLCEDKNHKDRESLEIIISEDAQYSYEYAINVGRFILGEAAISQKARWSYEYANDVIKGRWELGEAAIIKEAEYSYYYAMNVIDGRFELGEAAISKDAKYAYFYERNLIRGDWTPELAMMCPIWLYLYAKDVIKGRLPTVMHNKMISFGIMDSSDKYVKKYLGAKKYCTLKRKETKNDSRSSL